MKVINLDRFKNSQVVELDGKQYTVNGITVDMFLNNPIVEKLEGVAGTDRIKVIIEVLALLSDIPEVELLKQSLPMLTALMDVVQGNDPNAPYVAGDAVPNE